MTDEAHASGGRGRCVVLCDSAGVPPALREGLARRGLVAVEVPDAAAAALELAKARGDAGAAALVLVEPGLHEAVRELVVTARTYFPGVACWWYAVGQGDDRPRLDVFRDSALPASDSPHTVAADRHQEAAYTQLEEQPEPPTARDGGTGLPLLSAEELEMLLGVDVPGLLPGRLSERQQPPHEGGVHHAAAGLEAESEAST